MTRCCQLWKQTLLFIKQISLLRWSSDSIAISRLQCTNTSPVLSSWLNVVPERFFVNWTISSVHDISYALMVYILWQFSNFLLNVLVLLPVRLSVKLCICNIATYNIQLYIRLHGNIKIITIGKFRISLISDYLFLFLFVVVFFPHHNKTK